MSGEDPEADQEDAPLPDQVADATGKQQQSAERDQVSVHDPREVALREAEVLLDRRQRDIHDRGIDHDHQHARTKHIQRQPAPTLVGHLGSHVVEPPVELERSPVEERRHAGTCR
jgi:hypothetical protein